MQQVLNNKERNEAFLKFLLFFIITIVLVVLAIFFDFKLPVRENKALREKVGQGFHQDADQQKFVLLMNQGISLLDSMDKNNGSNLDQINAQLVGKINNEMMLRESGNPTYKTMNKAIADKLDELRVKKVKLKELGEAQSRLDKLQTELDECTQRLQNATMTIQGYQNSRVPGN